MDASPLGQVEVSRPFLAPPALSWGLLWEAFGEKAGLGGGVVRLWGLAASKGGREQGLTRPGCFGKEGKKKIWGK